MKVIIFLIIIAQILLVNTISIAGTSGFKDIPFGTGISEVNKIITEKYNYIIDYRDEEATVIYPFMIDDNVFKLYLLFDHENNFYAYNIVSTKYTADDFRVYVVDEAEYLTDVLSAKYNKPYKKYKPNFIDISKGYSTSFSEWKVKDLDVRVGFSTSDFLYYASAYVGSKKMLKAKNKFEKEYDKKSAKEAAKIL